MPRTIPRFSWPSRPAWPSVPAERLARTVLRDRQRFIQVLQGRPKPRVLEYSGQHQEFIIDGLWADGFKALHLIAPDVPCGDAAQFAFRAEDLVEMPRGRLLGRHGCLGTGGGTKFKPLLERLLNAPAGLFGRELILAQLLEEVMLINASVRLLVLAGALFTVSDAGITILEVPDAPARNRPSPLRAMAFRPQAAKSVFGFFCLVFSST